MTGLLWAVLGVLGGLGMTAIGDMVSEEVRDRLDHLPHAILRLAAKRLDPVQRTTIYNDEWLPELTYILKGDEARPVTRLYHGTRYAVGILVSARRIARALRQLTQAQHIWGLVEAHFDEQIAMSLRILDAAAAQLEEAKASHAKQFLVNQYEREVVSTKYIIDNLSAMKRWAERHR